jgi:hypothetical protein
LRSFKPVARATVKAIATKKERAIPLCACERAFRELKRHQRLNDRESIENMKNRSIS